MHGDDTTYGDPRRVCRIAHFLFDEEMPNETRPHQ